MYIRTYYIVHIARQTKCRKSLARLKEDRGTTARRTARRPRKQPRGLAHSWPLLARFNPEADLIGTQPTKSKSNERKACFLDVRGWSHLESRRLSSDEMAFLVSLSPDVCIYNPTLEGNVELKFWKICNMKVCIVNAIYFIVSCMSEYTDDANIELSNRAPPYSEDMTG